MSLRCVGGRHCVLARRSILNAPSDATVNDRIEVDSETSELKHCRGPTRIAKSSIEIERSQSFNHCKIKHRLKLSPTQPLEAPYMLRRRSRSHTGISGFRHCFLRFVQSVMEIGAIVKSDEDGWLAGRQVR